MQCVVLVRAVHGAARVSYPDKHPRQRGVNAWTGASKRKRGKGPGRTTAAQRVSCAAVEEGGRGWERAGLQAVQLSKLELFALSGWALEAIFVPTAGAGAPAVVTQSKPVQPTGCRFDPPTAALWWRRCRLVFPCFCDSMRQPLVQGAALQTAHYAPGHSPDRASSRAVSTKLQTHQPLTHPSRR